MPTKYFVQRGRVALISQGPDSGKLCVIIDIIDQNRALVSGPATGVRRQPLTFKKMRLTRFMLENVHPTIGDKRLLLKWQKTSISEDFAKTKAGNRLIARKKKASMTDFDRFKLYKTKQHMNKLIRKKTERLVSVEKKKRKEARKSPKQVAPKK